MDRQAFVLELIDRIYAAGFGERDWDEVMRPLRDALGCSAVAIHADDPGRGEALVVSNVGLGPEAVAEYEAYYASRNVWLTRAAPFVSAGALLHGEDLIARDELARTEYYNDFARPNRLGRAVAACLHQEPDLIALLSLFRTFDEDEFSGQDLEVVRTLVPHLQRAATASRVFHGLAAEARLAGAALDALPRGAVVLGGGGRVVVMNGRMEELLAAGDGIACRDARLRFRHPRSQRTLDGMLARRGLEGSGGAFRVPRPSCAPDYEVVVIRLPEARDTSSALIVPRVRSGWLVLVSDPARDVGRALPGLRRLHDLTEAEAEVARLLFAGMSLREVGEARGTSLDTVKSQTRSLYAKVGVSSRAELVRRLSVLERGPGAGRSGTS